MPLQPKRSAWSGCRGPVGPLPLCGAGDRRQSFEAWGERFPPWEERLARSEELVGAMRSLWQGQPVTMAGDHVRLHRAVCAPPPIRPPRVVLGVGGSRRALPTGSRIRRRAQRLRHTGPHRGGARPGASLASIVDGVRLRRLVMGQLAPGPASRPGRLVGPRRRALLRERGRPGYDRPDMHVSHVRWGPMSRTLTP